MANDFEITAAEVYEAPLLVSAGKFGEITYGDVNWPEPEPEGGTYPKEP